MSSTDAEGSAPAVADAQETPKLTLEVTVEKTNPCARHVIVRIDEADVRRYRDKAADELQPKAEVPGFRPGRAPRKLVEAKFKDEIQERTKGSLLLDAVTQVMDEQSFAAISEPDFDFDAVLLPDEGPLTFEFDVEVRPEFELPEWKRLKLKRYQVVPTEEDLDRQVELLKRRFSHLEVVDRPARHGDTLTLDIEVVDPESDEMVSRHEDVDLPVRSEIVFEDATVSGFAELMHEAKPGDTRSTKASLQENAANPELAGKEVEVRFHVKEVKEQVLPSMSELLDRLGEDVFEDEEDLRESLSNELEARLDYENRSSIREQIIDQLLAQTDLVLPSDLVKRQTQREIQRCVYELRSAGYDDATIKAHANRIQQESAARSERAIKEHFILERIAEELDVDATPEEFDATIARLALSRNESPRRVRARLEKRGDMDVIRNQIVEDKVIDLISEAAEFEEVPMDAIVKKPVEEESYGSDLALAGVAKVDLPEAKHPDTAQPMKAPTERG